mgnify:CR=1 FL=1
MLEMTAVFAKLEREMIVALVRSGIYRAKAKAEKDGKPKDDAEKERAIMRLRNQGIGMSISLRKQGLIPAQSSV